VIRRHHVRPPGHAAPPGRAVRAADHRCGAGGVLPPGRRVVVARAVRRLAVHARSARSAAARRDGGAANGWIDREAAILETLTSIRRGALVGLGRPGPAALHQAGVVVARLPGRPAVAGAVPIEPARSPPTSPRMEAGRTFVTRPALLPGVSRQYREVRGNPNIRPRPGHRSTRLSLHHRPEAPRGPQRTDLHRLRPAAHVRQPQGLRRSRLVQRVRRAPAHVRRADPAPRRTAVDGARRADHGGPHPRLRLHDAVAPRSERPAGQVRQEEAHRRDLGERVHALGRPRAPALHRVAPAALHDRQDQSCRRCHQRPVQPDGRLLRRLVDDGDLPRRDAGAGRPHPPRVLERLPDARPHQHRSLPRPRQAGLPHPGGRRRRRVLARPARRRRRRHREV
ncbi:MAG: Succinate dehydrogenase cytochrome b subunit, partial [uncultured Nocardioides sp.]